jgi:hypothetical protein
MANTLQWQPIKQRIEFNALLFIYKFVNNHTPNYLSEKITYIIRDTHQHATHLKNKISLPTMTKYDHNTKQHFLQKDERIQQIRIEHQELGYYRCFQEETE